MKPRLAGAAADRLVSATAAPEPPMTEDEVMRILARIARCGKPSDRLRAAELIGKQLGMFRDKGPGGGATLEELVLIEVVDPYAKSKDQADELNSPEIEQ